MAFITNRLRREVIESFLHTFSDTRHYVFAARSYPFDDDLNPDPENRSRGYQEYDLYRDIVFGKYVTPDDVVPMTKKVVWEPNQIYDHYDDTTDETQESNYIITSIESDGSASVFKCINNRLDGAVALTSHRPTRDEITVNDQFYMTADGYQWKYLYTVSATIMRKFSTDHYIPVIEDYNVTESAVPGAIESFIVENGGANYNSWVKGAISEPAVGGNTMIYGLAANDGLTLSSNSDFYTNSAIHITSGRGAGQVRKIIDYIVAGTSRRVLVDRPFGVVPDLSSSFSISPSITVHGDGNNSVAVAVINPISNSISHVEVIDPGTSYSFASVTVTGNTGYLNPDPEIQATIRPIISPPEGHGGDVISEVKANAVGVSIVFDKSEGGRLPATNDYRTFGVMKNPAFRNIEIDLSSSALLFNDGETVHQASSNTYAVVDYRIGTTLVLDNVRGDFKVGDPVVGLTSNVSATPTTIRGDTFTFDNRVYLEIETIDSGPMGRGFVEDEEVFQPETGVTGRVHSADTARLTLTNVKGVFSVSDSVSGVEATVRGVENGAVGKIIAKREAGLIPSSGKTLYIENTYPIRRDADQSENIKLILEI